MRKSARRVFVGANFETAMKPSRFAQVGAPLTFDLLFFAGGVIIPSTAVAEAVTEALCDQTYNSCLILCRDKDQGAQL